MASFVKVQYCILCENTRLVIAGALVYCEDEDNCDFVLNREDAQPEKMSAHVDKMVFCYNCGETLKRSKRRLMCHNGCGNIIPIPTDHLDLSQKRGLVRPSPQASSATEQSSHADQTSAPTSVSSGTLALSETSTELKARKPTTYVSVSNSADPAGGGGAEAVQKPMDSSVDEQPSADSSDESTSTGKDIKSDEMDSQTSEHNQQNEPLVPQGTGNRAESAPDDENGAAQVFSVDPSSITKPEEKINHRLEDAEQLQLAGSQSNSPGSRDLRGSVLTVDPGGGAEAPKPINSSVHEQTSTESADSSGESISSGKDTKNDHAAMNSKTSEHNQQSEPLVPQEISNRESALDSTDENGSAQIFFVDTTVPNKLSNVTKPEEKINHPLESEDVEQLPVEPGSQLNEEVGILHQQENSDSTPSQLHTAAVQTNLSAADSTANKMDLETVVTASRMVTRSCSAGLYTDQYGRPRAGDEAVHSKRITDPQGILIFVVP